ncbi:adenylate/guanylate cyclase domain-containing protein [Pseudomonas sp. NFIX28]|uniref:adenylate/guanylate cyclase domain-containing protein n=1 Tax=Pseudomonas sp. NFIX28 TaxID=1566235 RepID=UPI000A68581C|nr:adenylate/guanylate cyclase domain-containing protein [Pseudomonas sp. NFIX28]
MSSLKDVYKSFDRVFDRSIQKSMGAPGYGLKSLSGNVQRRAMDSSEMLASSNVAEAEFGIQEAIRGLFGKKRTNAHSIGGHPDFQHLDTPGMTDYGFNVSLFLDIKGSTKLGLVYSPEEVFFIKNTIIRCAIETIRAFDGHVHRIMGDAILAFFRSDGISARDAAIDAINCGCYLVEFMRQLVAPKLRDNNVAEDVGIRVGVDYGQHNDVLWGMYGFQGSSEVTATSYFVDVAAKLQQSAPRNRVMIGESIRSLLDIHDGMTELKRINSGEAVEQYVMPNYTGADGKPVNYKKYVLKQEKYFALLPKPEWNDAPIKVTALLKAKNNVIYQDPEVYHACSRALSKGVGIDFKAKFFLPYTTEKVQVRFRVKNHGQEAGDDLGYEVDVDAQYNRERGEYWASYWRNTAYTGLHYMVVSVLVNGRTEYKGQEFGVYVGAPS